jgi:site-specific DNA recombinase
VQLTSLIQKDRSAEDQFALCEAYAAREGYEVVAKFADRGKTGATTYDRDELAQMRDAAKRGEFDAIIVENLDRLSRDQEDLAGVFKRLTHYGVKLLSVNEGETTSIQVGIRGIVGSLFLKDLAGKVKRGHDGIVREGKFPGAVTYGYDRIWDEANRKYKAGERTINETEAKIIMRIFTEYASGKSPREIANDLTRDGVPTPSGGTIWNHQTFVGGSYARGIIGNRLYIGEIVWNTHYTVRDPDTDKKQKRVSPESDHLIVQAPAFRIIDQDLWDRAQAVRTQRAVAMFGPGGKRTGPLSSGQKVIPRTRHGEYLLTGILRCAVCNSHMRIAQNSRNGNPRVACAAAHQHSTCSHTKSYDIGDLEIAVLDGFKNNLLDPESIKQTLAAFHSRYSENQKKNSADRINIEKQINRLAIQIERLVDAIADGDELVPVKTLTSKLREKEAERVSLEERLRLLKVDNVVTLHPKILDAYRENVAALHAVLTGGRASKSARIAFQSLVDSVVVHPTGKRMPADVSVYGRLSAMLGINLFPTPRSAEKVIEDEGVTRNDNVHTLKSVSS